MSRGAYWDTELSEVYRSARHAPSGETECLRNCRDVSYMDWNVLKDGDMDSEGETPGGDEGAPHLND